MHHRLTGELPAARRTCERAIGEVSQYAVAVALHQMTGTGLEVVIESCAAIGTVDIDGVAPASACHSSIVLKPALLRHLARRGHPGWSVLWSTSHRRQGATATESNSEQRRRQQMVVATRYIQETTASVFHATMRHIPIQRSFRRRERPTLMSTIAIQRAMSAFRNMLEPNPTASGFASLLPREIAHDVRRASRILSPTKAKGRARESDRCRRSVFIPTTRTYVL